MEPSRHVATWRLQPASGTAARHRQSWIARLEPHQARPGGTSTTSLCCFVAARWLGQRQRPRGRPSRGCRPPVRAEEVRCFADWAPNAGLWIGWPCDSTAGEAVRRAGFEYFTSQQYAELRGFVAAAAARQAVTLVTSPGDVRACEKCLGDLLAPGKVEILELEHVNWWIRDIGPTFLRRVAKEEVAAVGGVGVEAEAAEVAEAAEAVEAGVLSAVCWDFHGYGAPPKEGRRKFYSFYSSSARRTGWRAGSELDARLSTELASEVGATAVTGSPCIAAFEGGALVCDGEGTALVVAEMLPRTGASSRQELEACLAALGLQKVLWLPHGLSPGTEGGNCHADMVAAFLAPGKVLLLAAHAEDDPGVALRLSANFKAIQGALDARGRALEVTLVSRPRVDWLEKGLQRYNLTVGRWYAQSLERSYTNLVFLQDAVLVPQFGDRSSDGRALQIIGEVCKAAACDRGLEAPEVVPVPFKEVARLGGGLRCCSLPMPAQAA